ncbi:MAG TPA: type II and III secretion system protein family protein [Sphingomonadales bacterium]|nr:type II and III secretion system protein family protein [Sphingomonadales bacterium]
MKKTLKQFAVAALSLGFAGLLMALAAPTAAEAAAILQHQENAFSVEVNRGVLVRLDQDATNIFIANPEVADVQVKSARLFYVFGKRTGETTLYAVDERENVIYSAAIAVSPNLARLQETIDSLLPTAVIKVTNVNGLILMTGSALSPDDADTAQSIVRSALGDGPNIMNRVEISTPTQVNLRVKIAEMSRDTLKQLGFNWNAIIEGAANTFAFGHGREVFQVFRDDDGNVTNKELLRSPTASSMAFRNLGGQHDLGVILDALEAENYISILAEPNLTALSGETASFLAGGEFPIPIPNAGFGTVTLQFKQFGVGLTFTPTVLSENKINLRVAPEVSQLSEAGAITINDITVPALTTRKANTTVELASGQSFAIAGLLQSNIGETADKFPWLGDIPILGTLFRSTKFQRNETELVIIVTPYIVRPVSPGRLMSPLDVNHLPDDTGRYVKGIGQIGSDTATSRDLAGNGGLQMDQ